MGILIYNEKEERKSCLKGVIIKYPEVPLEIIPTIEDVHFSGDFTFAVMAQSPNYTPKSADYIMDIFRNYILEI